MNTRERIRNFNKVFGRPVNTELQELSVSERVLLGKILFEEVLETLTKGLGLELTGKPYDPVEGEYLSNRLELVHVEGQKYDPIETGDGLGDTNVVIHFVAHWAGMNLDALTNEIDCSNHSKVGEDGQPIINGYTKGFRASGWDGHSDTPAESGYRWDLPIGKILKGPNFRKPNIAGVLELGNHPDHVRRVDPQIRYAVERALERAKNQLDAERNNQERLGCVTLQGVAWADEVESLECAVDILKAGE